MSRKQRTTIRRKNYRAWKQEHKQATAPSVAKPAGPNAPTNAQEPIDHAALIQQLRSPDLSSGERDSVALDIEQYAVSLLFKRDDPDPDATELISEQLRRDVVQVMREFGSTLFDEEPESLPEPAPVAPGHSTGPRTEAGLARSSQNARKHGLSSLTSIFVMMPGEDPHEWVQLIDDLNQEFQPATRTERILVNDMAQSHWLTQRAINLQTSHIEDPKFFALYLRYQTTHHRAYYRALKQLLTLQKSRTQANEKPVLYPKLTSQHIEPEPQSLQSISEPQSARSGAGSPDPRRSPERSGMPTSGSSNTETSQPQAA
jgi:hypothetical protein